MALADYGAYPGHDDPKQFASISGAVPGTSAAISLGGLCFRVVIQIIGGSGVYINFADTATPGNYLIPPGGTFVYQGRPVGLVHILGVAATGTYSIHGN
jgi:hypothetical protein